MPSNRVYVDLIPKGGRVSKWNPSVTPVESLSWRRKTLLNSTIEEVPLTTTRKNLTYLLTPVNFTFPLKRKQQSFTETISNESKRNLSFLFSGSPPPPVVTENLEWRRRLQSIDYSLEIVRIGRNLVSVFYTPTPPIPPEPPGPPDFKNYYRRYLNDTTTPLATGPPVTFSTSPETNFTRYIKRYLNN